ncbi:hypothetical protein OZO98_001772 [Salmonella enterica]|nr:hypothetical protein [Salmonella enterica]
MKLIVDDIKLSESYASTTVEVETGTYPCLPLSICTMDVSVPLVEGKALEQYKEELLAKARERIDIMYKEIVCGGETSKGEVGQFPVEDGEIIISASQLKFISPWHKGRLALNSEGYLTITPAKL